MDAGLAGEDGAEGGGHRLHHGDPAVLVQGLDQVERVVALQVGDGGRQVGGVEAVAAEHPRARRVVGAHGDDDLRRLGLGVMGLADALIKIEEGLYAQQANTKMWTDWKVVAKEPTGNAAVTFRFEPADDTPQSRGRAGGYVSVRLKVEDGLRQCRQYSLSEKAGSATERVITVKLDEGGEVSPMLIQNVEVGDVIELSNPYGDITLRDDADTPLVLATAGIGITPAAAILDTLASHASRLFSGESAAPRAEREDDRRAEDRPDDGGVDGGHQGGEVGIALGDLHHRLPRGGRGRRAGSDRGGIGGRGGPGEKQIELDRRMINEAVKRTKERLEKVAATLPRDRFDPAFTGLTGDAATIDELKRQTGSSYCEMTPLNPDDLPPPRQSLG
mgnify:CR=1 FL=1